MATEKSLEKSAPATLVAQLFGSTFGIRRISRLLTDTNFRFLAALCVITARCSFDKYLHPNLQMRSKDTKKEQMRIEAHEQRSLDSYEIPALCQCSKG